MQPKNRTHILYLVIAAVFLGVSFSGAGQAGSSIRLVPTDAHPGATGSAIVDGNQIRLQARGLRPESVYTVWFVNTTPQKHEAGAGQPPYTFKTDAAGNGSYSSRLDTPPHGTWQKIMVVLHPDGDPKNMNNMVGALVADLS